MIINLIDYLIKRRQTIKTWAYIALAVMLVWTIVGVDKHHAHTWMEMYIPGYWALFTIIACLLLIFFSRWISKSGIMTREYYYDN